MSDCVNREDVINKLADEYLFEATEYDGEFTREDFIDVAKETLADVPTVKVVPYKEILKVAEEQEKQGFIQTAEVLKDLVRTEEEE